MTPSGESLPAHLHTPELRERRHYDPAVIRADAWVCAECGQFLCWEVNR